MTTTRIHMAVGVSMISVGLLMVLLFTTMAFA